MEVKFKYKDKKISTKLTDEEIQFFVEYAVVDLIKKGVISVEEEESFLSNCDVQDLPRA